MFVRVDLGEVGVVIEGAEGEGREYFAILE